MKWQVHDYLIPVHYIVTTVNFMVGLGVEKANICFVEVIGDICQQYILKIAFNELMKIGSNSYEPIYFGHVFNRIITLHIIYEVTPEWCQPILISRV